MPRTRTARSQPHAAKPPLTVRLAAPRGFCAGVRRAIESVEQALHAYGAPIYVRHQIVHHPAPVAQLAAQGAIFVEELSEVPRGARVVFSAHGVAKSVRAEARARDLKVLDATCPLVTKVHREAEQYWRAGRHILLLGHAGHPEIMGTMGQLPSRAISLVETAAAARRVRPPADMPLALLTQTTLSLDDTHTMREILRRRFGALEEPAKEDICYATTNRQHAVKALAAQCDYMLVVGGAHSSNSQRLLETARRAGCSDGALIGDASALPWAALARARIVGLSAGASTPEPVVQNVLAALRARFTLQLEEQTPRQIERVRFALPQALRADA